MAIESQLDEYERLLQLKQMRDRLYTRGRGGLVGARHSRGNAGAYQPSMAGALGPGPNQRYDWNYEQWMLEREAAAKMAPIIAEQQMKREQMAADMAKQANALGASWAEGERDIGFKGAEAAASRAQQAAMQEQEFGFRGQESAMTREQQMRLAQVEHQSAMERLGLSRQYGLEQQALSQEFQAGQGELTRQQQDRTNRFGMESDIARTLVQGKLTSERDQRLAELDAKRLGLVHEYGMDTMGAEHRFRAGESDIEGQRRSSLLDKELGFRKEEGSLGRTYSERMVDKGHEFALLSAEIAEGNKEAMAMWERSTRLIDAGDAEIPLEGKDKLEKLRNNLHKIATDRTLSPQQKADAKRQTMSSIFQIYVNPVPVPPHRRVKSAIESFNSQTLRLNPATLRPFAEGEPDDGFGIPVIRDRNGNYSFGDVARLLQFSPESRKIEAEKEERAEWQKVVAWDSDRRANARTWLGKQVDPETGEPKFSPEDIEEVIVGQFGQPLRPRPGPWDRNQWDVAAEKMDSRAAEVEDLPPGFPPSSPAGSPMGGMPFPDGTTPPIAPPLAAPPASPQRPAAGMPSGLGRGAGVRRQNPPLGGNRRRGIGETEQPSAVAPQSEEERLPAVWGPVVTRAIAAARAGNKNAQNDLDERKIPWRR